MREFPLARAARSRCMLAASPMPVVASYCTTFLKPEMLHIYRQITGLRAFETFVMTKERRCEEQFPFDAIELLPRPRINFLARFQKKYLLRMEPVFYRGEYDQLATVLARRHADLLHVYFGHTGVHLLPFIRNWPGPSVVSFHGMDIMPRAKEPGYGTRMRELLAALPMVLARSESLARRLIDLGCDPAKIRLNRTGIPLEAFPFAERPTPANGAWQLVQASRLIEKKGLDDALRAFAAFHAAHPAATFTVAGDGPQRATLEALASELGVAKAVTFAGFQSQAELRALYERSHLFLHPSRTTAAQDQEGVPNSMLEAMATGLPVFATNHGGIPEAIEHGSSGLLVNERDHSALARALIDTVQDPPRLAKLGLMASQSVAEKFDQHTQVRRLEEIYLGLL